MEYLKQIGRWGTRHTSVNGLIGSKPVHPGYQQHGFLSNDNSGLSDSLRKYEKVWRGLDKGSS
jgi:hypothetical protein